MILIAASVSLLAIYAGAKLLADSKKEMLNGLFKFISWFIILSGFLLFSLTFVMACKKHYHPHKHPGAGENPVSETCDHTCVKTQHADSVNFKDVHTRACKRNSMSMENCSLCKCCNESMLMQGVDCCKKESSCCAESGSIGMCKMHEGDHKSAHKDSTHK